MFNRHSGNKMDVQTRRNLLYLYDAFPNFDRPIIDAVFEECNFDLDRVSDMLIKMLPPTKPVQLPRMHTLPIHHQQHALRQFPLKASTMENSIIQQLPLPNEYVHKFEMKQGDVLPSTSNKPTGYDQLYYVNQPYLMNIDPITDNRHVRQHTELIDVSNDVPQLAEAKGSVEVDELRKEIQNNKEMMLKLVELVDTLQSQVQIKVSEDATTKTEEKVAQTKEEVEMLNQIKRKSEIKKLLMLQQDIDMKLKENKESVIDMLDNFKLQMQNLFADQMKSLNEDDKGKETVTASAPIDHNAEEPEPSSSKTENEREYPSIEESLDTNEIIPFIQEGCKVLLLMRGLPGSGKTTLASSILYKGVGKVNRHEFIFSINDYFKKTGLPLGDDADDKMKHAILRNQRRCYEAMKVGVSPIIIDDNNLEIYEMRLYCTLATMFGYIIEIVEPQTPWALDTTILADRNSLGVDEIEIQRMLARFQQNVTVDDLKQEFKLSYKDDMPQFRKYPAIPESK